MAKTLKLSLDGKLFEASLTKIDRKKIYGFTQVEVKDGSGMLCKMSTITSDGKYILQSGSTGIMTFNDEGSYVPRSDMQVVNNEGEPIEKVASSYDLEAIPLQECTVEDYLDLRVKGIYQVSMEDYEELFTRLENGKIYSFEYCYRAAYDADDAFLLNANGNTFLIIGTQLEYEFIGLESNVMEIIEADAEVSLDDDFDMGML